MLKEMSLEEFRDSGALWFVNQQLHLFGMVLAVDVDNGKCTNLRPVKCKYRGFGEKENDAGYRKLTRHMVNNSESWMEDCE